MAGQKIQRKPQTWIAGVPGRTQNAWKQINRCKKFENWDAEIRLSSQDFIPNSDQLRKRASFQLEAPSVRLEVGNLIS